MSTPRSNLSRHVSFWIALSAALVSGSAFPFESFAEAVLLRLGVSPASSRSIANSSAGEYGHRGSDSVGEEGDGGREVGRLGVFLGFRDNRLLQVK
jgi:hypothetical protein